MLKEEILRAVMRKHTALTLVFHLLLTPTCVLTLKYCYKGTYEIVREDGYLQCDLCPEGTYMPEYDHRQRACYNCTKPESQLEVVYSPCNRTHDAVIHCVEGYYRDLPRNVRENAKCKNCTVCRFTGRPCQPYNDTICCMQENSEVVTHQDGYLTCQERPYLCMKGQYMETSAKECLPCPSNTFMPLDYHVMKECWKCPLYDLPLHAEIIQPCNSTHASVVACKKGFYMSHAMGLKDSSIGCSQCTDCSKAGLYEGRACDGVNDTVCCPQPNMTVLDMTGGPLCEKPPLEIATSAPPPLPCCEEDQRQISESSNSSFACQPCPTTPSSTNNMTDSCENCTAEFSGEQLLKPTPKTSTTESCSGSVDITSPSILCFIIAMVVSILFNVVCLLFCLYYRRVFRSGVLNPPARSTRSRYDSNHDPSRAADTPQSDTNGSAEGEPFFKPGVLETPV